MHEEALLADLRRTIDDVARRESVARIVRVHLWVGALAHVTPAGVQRRWPETVRGSAAEGAELTIDSSTDVADPRATGIVLVRVDAADPDPAGSTEPLFSPPARRPLREGGP